MSGSLFTFLVVGLLLAPGVVAFLRDIPGAWRNDSGLLPTWVGRCAVALGVGIPSGLILAAVFS